MYRPGTLVTLKDGKVYRTSKDVYTACEMCREFYKHLCKFPPCSPLYLHNPFRVSKYYTERYLNYRRHGTAECRRLYGKKRFPKLVELCGNQDN